MQVALRIRSLSILENLLGCLVLNWLTALGTLPSQSLSPECMYRVSLSGIYFPHLYCMSQGVVLPQSSPRSKIGCVLNRF